MTVALAPGDHDAVRGIHDRLVFLIPTDPVVLVVRLSQHLDDLSAPRRLSVDAASFKPIASSCLRS